MSDAITVTTSPQTLATTAPDVDPHAQVLIILAQTRRQKTVEAYRQDLLRCGSEAMEGCHDPLGVLRTLIAAGPGGCYQILARWIGAMRTRNLAQLTIHRRIAGVQAVLRHVRKHGLITWQIAMDRHDLGAAVPRRDTRGPTPVQVHAMVAAAAAQADPAQAARDGAVLWLLVGCGLRSHEVRGLAIGHVDLTRAELRILGKGRREREVVPLPSPAVVALERWMAHRRAAAVGDPLFTRLDRARPPSMPAVALSSDGVNRLIHRLADLAGLGADRCWPHALRHTAITTAAHRSNGNALAVRTFARHASLVTSQRYIDDIDQADLVRATTDLVGAVMHQPTTEE